MARHILPTMSLLARTLASRVRRSSRSCAPPNGAIRVSGIRQEIWIGRDDAGVPHVFAEHLADLAFGLGVATAQDRLWQMETMRWLGQGRMAEIVGDRPLRTSLHIGGASLVALDEFYRCLRMEAVAREELATLAEETVLFLTAFARGVNAWSERLKPSQKNFLKNGMKHGMW